MAISEVIIPAYKKMPSPSVFGLRRITDGYQVSVESLPALVERGGKWEARLELEVELSLDRPRAKCIIRTTKVRIRNVAFDAHKVDLVEQVECVGADFDAGTFTQHLHRGQAEGFRGREIKVRVTRTNERIAADSRDARKGRRCWNMTGVAPGLGIVHNRRFGEVRLAAFREVARSSLERIG